MLIEMGALRKMTQGSVLTNLMFAGVLVMVLPIVKGKPFLGDAEIDVPIPAEGCFFPLHNRTYAVGDRWGMGPPFGCIGMKCDGPKSMSGLSCATFLAGPECEEDPGDQTAVYPDCCPFPRCPTEATDLNTPKPTDHLWEDNNAYNIP